ncbi:hypothetical protein Pmani_017898 [Petrolisthes manimaculis]|uniref:Uncharacterized protein n=1 Tax=Petrolisthes manimaculis TaxID=1843537 RepID=A0AAE1PME9_9EUCA|nr:hypothetical protein Pmani_017898 [Petrolisthes manimaculis]
MARGRGTGEGAAWQQQQRRLGPPLLASPVMSCDTCPVIAGQVGPLSSGLQALASGKVSSTPQLSPPKEQESPAGLGLDTLNLVAHDGCPACSRAVLTSSIQEVYDYFYVMSRVCVR